MADDAKTLLQKYQPKEVKVLKVVRQLSMLRFSPCGKVLAGACYDGSIRRWDAAGADLAELTPLTAHHGWAQAIACHLDGQRLFSVDSWGKLCCWHYADKDARPLWSVERAHDGWIRSLALSPNGKLLATCGLDQKVRLWSADDGAARAEWVGHNQDAYSVAFHPDGKSVVSGDLRGVIKVWDIGTGKPVRQLDAAVMYLLSRLQDVGGVRCLTFDARGETLFAAGSQPKGGATMSGIPTILSFDWKTGTLKKTVTIGTPNDCYVHDLHVHPAGAPVRGPAAASGASGGDQTCRRISRAP